MKAPVRGSCGSPAGNTAASCGTRRGSTCSSSRPPRSCSFAWQNASVWHQHRAFGPGSSPGGAGAFGRGTAACSHRVRRMWRNRCGSERKSTNNDNLEHCVFRKKGGRDMPGARILLVEDDEVLCKLIVRNLEARGHDMHVAADAHTALAQLRANPFDLILLDICLPDETGWEVLRVAQKQGWLAPVQMNGNAGQLPVAVLSAVSVRPRRLVVFRPLPSLPKPFSLDALLRRAPKVSHRRKCQPVT